jgi:ABC-2 type transport system ATP-binding protein
MRSADARVAAVRGAPTTDGAGSASPAVETIELTKRYGSITALAGLTMRVPRGAVFGFLGPNGAGKTTAVKLLVGLARPTTGSGSVLGAPLGDRLARRRIGYLPELFRYQAWLSAREVLQLHCSLAGIPQVRRRQEVEAALDTVGLVRRGNDRVGTFSKGMQQRLGLGVALLGEPELVFLDEPTSALDPVGRHDVREIIRGLRQRGAAVFLNSHLLSEVEQVCDLLAVVDQGRVIATGTLDELLGATSSVRLRLGGVGSAGETAMRRFGSLDIEGDSYTVRGLSAGAVPALVAAVVELGVQVFAVEPRQQSLEDRFLQLLGGDPDGSADHRAADSA